MHIHTCTHAVCKFVTKAIRVIWSPCESCQSEQNMALGGERVSDPRPPLFLPSFLQLPPSSPQVYVGRVSSGGRRGGIGRGREGEALAQVLGTPARSSHNEDNPWPSRAPTPSRTESAEPTATPSLA